MRCFYISCRACDRAARALMHRKAVGALGGLVMRSVLVKVKVRRPAFM